VTLLPNLLSLPEFVFRVTARPSKGSVFVLVSPADLIDRVSGRLRSELEGEVGVQLVGGAHDAGALISAIQKAEGTRIVIACGIESFGDTDWQRIDLLRSRLSRDGAIIFVVSPASVEALTRYAPNLASWVGGSMWIVDIASELLTPEERESRLNALREGFQRSDTEILRLAAEGSLPKEPEYVEWLILLKRPDLIGNT